MAGAFVRSFGYLFLFLFGLFLHLPKISYCKTPRHQVKSEAFDRIFERATLDRLSLGSDTDTNNAFVDHGSVVVFHDNLPAQSQEDVLASTLLAQLAADKKYNRFEDPSNWYKFYDEVLGNIGWVLGSFSSFEKYQPKKESFTLSDVVMDKGGAAYSEEVAKVITMLENNTAALNLLKQNIYSSKRGNFQLLLCSDELTANLFEFYFASSSNKGFPLYPSNKETIELHLALHTITLNESLYSRVREEIKKKLGDKYATNVHAI